VRVTVAPGTTADCESATVPVTVPVVNWAEAGREAPHTAAPIMRIVRILFTGIAFLLSEHI